MKRAVRTGAIIAASVVVGAILGPVLFAVIGAIAAPAEGTGGRSIEANKLVDAYRNKLPPFRLFTTVVMPDDGAECGYDAGKVFPGGILAMMKARQANSYSDYEGYYALDQWRNRNQDEDWIDAIKAQISMEMSPFEAGFLRRCIESTVFSNLCMRQVEGFGDTVPRFSSKREHFLIAAGDEDRVVCTFVDGVAARRGIPLSKRAGDRAP
jgi:hypothetical protein